MNNKVLWILSIASFFFFSCKKESIHQVDTAQTTAEEINKSARSGMDIAGNQFTETITGYTTYIIRKGQHYSDKRLLKSVNTTEMKFYAKFNQTAIYQTVNPANQYDINKLWGFSEGFNNQYNSARIGWGYSNGDIRLYGYVYARGVVHYSEITTVMPGEDILCSIKISGSSYIITAKGVTVTLPRGTTALRASGYQQYPYFGGNEVAPHDIYIYIKPV